MASGNLKMRGADTQRWGEAGSEHHMACEMLPEGGAGETPDFSIAGPDCPAGMEYRECVSPCTRTCQSLHINEVCREQCVDGCSCPGNRLFT